MCRELLSHGVVHATLGGCSPVSGNTRDKEARKGQFGNTVCVAPTIGAVKTKM